MTEDESQLNSLAVAHYVVGGLSMIFACLPLIHAFIGWSVISGMGGMHEAMGNRSNEAPPEWFGWLFFFVGSLFFLLGQAVSILLILSGRFLKQRRNYLFSFVLACIACTAFPVGTVLGILTILVLSRDSVKTIYGR